MQRGDRETARIQCCYFFFSSVSLPSGRFFFFLALLLLLSRAGLWRALGAFLVFLLNSVYMEGFVLECSCEQSSVSCRFCLDDLAKAGVGGGDEVWVILSGSVHNLAVKRKILWHHQYILDLHTHQLATSDLHFRFWGLSSQHMASDFIFRNKKPHIRYCERKSNYFAFMWKCWTTCCSRRYDTAGQSRSETWSFLGFNFYIYLI